MPERLLTSSSGVLRGTGQRFLIFRRLSPMQATAASFLAVILVGAGLLMVPFAQQAGAQVGFLDALFTATSATCLVGLSTVDLATTWSPFGLTVILVMVQLGAIGYMSAFLLIALLLGARLGMPRGLMITEAGGVIGPRDMWRIVRSVALISLALEAFGALLLALRFGLHHGESFGAALTDGVFYGITAFCNTGFMLNPAADRPEMWSDMWMLVILSSLTILGGLGVGVLIEVARFPREQALSVHTRMVLITTAVLLVLGAVLFYLFERYNPGTLGSLPGTGSHLITSWFMSATARSAGFTPVDLSLISPPTLFILVLLTVIGASPGGTGGGVKTTTLAVIGLAITALVRHRMDIEVFKRRISGEIARQALSVVSFYLLILLLLIVGISLVEIARPGMQATQETMAHYANLVFTTASSFGCTGWDAGVVADLHPISRVLLIISMFLGRLGTLAFIYFFARSKRPVLRRLPNETVVAG
ncbi:MAG: TrkH family potassium uptake protein [Armatimonadota bacterium]